MSKFSHDVHGNRRAFAANFAMPNPDDYIGSSHGAETKRPLTDADAALTMGCGHPKCGAIPSPLHRYGFAIDESTSGKPQPGIGVGGALPIGAFQS